MKNNELEKSITWKHFTAHSDAASKKTVDEDSSEDLLGSKIGNFLKGAKTSHAENVPGPNTPICPRTGKEGSS
jgi:hypothetical protein